MQNFNTYDFITYLVPQIRKMKRFFVKKSEVSGLQRLGKLRITGN